MSVHFGRAALVTVVLLRDHVAILVGPSRCFRRLGRSTVDVVRYGRLPAFGLGPLATVVWTWDGPLPASTPTPPPVPPDATIA